MKVLVVDDSEMIQERVKEIAENSRTVCCIYQAFKISEAKDIIQKQKIDVVIIDIRLPDGTGFEFIDFIKNNFDKIMMIMITNYPFKQYKIKAKEMGVNYFFCKQNDFDLLEPALDQLKLARKIMNLN